MIGEEASPGRVERLIRAIPEGAVLRGVFVALLVIAVAVAGVAVLVRWRQGRQASP